MTFLRMAGVFLVIALSPAIGLPQTDDALNTLLYTPAQRQAIDQARQGPRGGEGGAVAGAGAEVRNTPSRTRLDGVVARERGKGTAWVNSEPVAQGSNPSTRILGTEAVVDGHRLRVGESFDNSTGAKSDLVAPGAVHTRRSP